MSNPIKCIFCLEDKIGSEEHIFPDSIGGVLVFNEVCTKCNNELGSKVDTHLINHYLMQLARLTKKIKGKTGKIPNPFREGMLEGKSESKVHYRFNDDGDPESVYIVPSQELSEDGASLKILIDRVDEHKLPDIINKTLKRRGLPSLTKEEIDEKKQYEIIPDPKINYKPSVDTNSYRKAIIKIVYELTYYWLGKKYLDDTMGSRLRNYIRSDAIDVDGIYGNAVIVDKSLESDNFLYLLANEDSHIGMLLIDGNNIYCTVNLFNTFQGSFLVSENAENYPYADNKFLENDVLNEQVRESAYETELLRRGYFE
ncbi:hypothetical protein CSV72_02115 [Sporosarcina sp. P20a]|uniref:HNH endonuclease n=1 Tax=Sporosarcina sp. P20a TaxID=2048256 RepID=UPI000C16885F|nr:HNH endonuclease [Sporosarcina sp. P20a]PIC87965.1 hypothetical protein CSV72_02115 [Sporosarcina sp. P20a]